MSKKRDRLEIIHCILKTIRDAGNRMKPTHVMYKSNLSHQMLTKYLNELLKKGFIQSETTGEKFLYTLTDKGFTFLSDYSMIRNFMDSYGLEE